MNKYFTFCLLFIISLWNTILTAQGKIQTDYFQKNPDQTVTSIKNDAPLRADDQMLLNRINEIKSGKEVVNEDEFRSLIQTFNKRNGIIDKQAEPYNGRIIFTNEKFKKINSQTSLIYSGNIKSFSSATEQIGSTMGRVWIAFTHNNLSSQSGPDTLDIFWSDDGLNFTSFAQATLGGTDIFSRENLDMEIIEKTDGSKFLWILYTYFNGHSRIGGVVFDLIHPGGSMFALTWPGQSINSEYYDVHITSDNSVDSSLTWLFIACSMDSVGAGGNTFYGQKFAYIWQTSQLGAPSVLYRAQVLPVFWQSGDTEIRHLFTDVAYFRSPGDTASLMFTYSNIPDSTKIWLTKSDATGTSANFLGVLGSSHHISHSKIAAPGGIGNSQLMVIGTQNWQNSGDWDLVSWKTLDGGVTWDEAYIEPTSSTTQFLPSWPAIYVKWKNRNNYRVSYNLGSGTFWLPDSVMFVKSVAGSGNSWQTAVKVSDISFPGFISRVGFAGNSSDDCFVLWSDFDQLSLYSTSCANPVSVEDNTVTPGSFVLMNNFPNPFNPSTKIRFQIPATTTGKNESQNTTLKVYDVLGNEVATLVNELKSAGTYEVEFDASGLSSGVYYYRLTSGRYSETKKMVLLR